MYFDKLYMGDSDRDDIIVALELSFSCKADANEVSIAPSVILYKRRISTSA